MPAIHARLGTALVCSSLFVAPVPVATGQDAPTDAELIAATDALVSEALMQPGAVGLSVAIARGGEIIHAAGYGLAEATLAVSSASRGSPSVRCDVRSDALSDHRVVKAAEDEEQVTFIGCGPPMQGTKLAIVDPVLLTRQPAERSRRSHHHLRFRLAVTSVPTRRGQRGSGLG